MNLVDGVILVILIFFAIESLTRPFILELIDFVSFLLSFFLSFSFYNFPAKFIENKFNIPHTLSLTLGFMVMWFATEILVYIFFKRLLLKLPKVNFPKVFSIIPAVLRGLLLIALFLVMIATFPIQPVVKKAVLDSKIGSQILKNAYSLEQPVKNVFGGVANDSLAFLTIKPKTNERINLGFQTTQFTIDTTSEQGMFKLVNQERTSRGIKALSFDTKLQSIAREHAKDMFERGYFSHYSLEGKSVADRAEAAGIDYLVLGENLAYAPDLEAAHKGLMNSEGHRENILSKDYGKVGIGVLDAGVYGRMFVQVFSN